MGEGRTVFCERVVPMAINHLSPPTGLIADNVVGFARALRAAGMPVGPGAVIDALNALQVIEIGNRADVYTTLEAIFVKRHEHALIFAQAFSLFFRAAEEWKHLLDSVPLPDHARKKPPPASRRVQEAMSQPQMTEAPEAQEQEIRLSVSDAEVLQKKDFAQMSAAEIATVTRAIAQMKLPQAELRTRRYQPDARGSRLDMRRTLRGSLPGGPSIRTNLQAIVVGPRDGGEVNGRSAVQVGGSQNGRSNRGGQSTGPLPHVTTRGQFQCQRMGIDLG